MDRVMHFFVKDYNNINSAAVRAKSGKTAGIIGIISNLLLFAIKLIAGLLSMSVAMIADAVNNLSDSASSIVLLIGFKLSEKPADGKHPFGHARIEYVTGMIVSFIIIVLGIQLVISSGQDILAPRETEYGVLTFVILGVSIVIKVWQALFYRSVGRHIRSEAIFATSFDSRNDVLVTSAILIGAVITQLTGFNLDGYLGLAVAIFIVISGIMLVIDTTNPLLGSPPDDELVTEIHKKIMSYDGVLGMHDLTVHNYGEGRTFASVHCEVPAEEDILTSHDVIDNIERDFKRDLNINLVIHLDPIVTNDERTNALKENVVEEVRGIDERLSIHDFRVVWGRSHTNVIFDVAVPFDLDKSDAEIEAEITEAVHKINETYFAVMIIDRTDSNETAYGTVN